LAIISSAAFAGSTLIDLLEAEGWRWGGAERRAPQGAKLAEAEGPHTVDLGLDRLAIE
jgi:hypothetical protein